VEIPLRDGSESPLGKARGQRSQTKQLPAIVSFISSLIWIEKQPLPTKIVPFSPGRLADLRVLLALARGGEQIDILVGEIVTGYSPARLGVSAWLRPRAPWHIVQRTASVAPRPIGLVERSAAALVGALI